MAGPAATITLSPDGLTRAAGSAVTYQVGAVDEFGNPLPDQTAASTVRATPADGPAVPCPQAVCTLDEVGVYAVTASLPVPGSVITDTTTLNIVPGPVDALGISPLDAISTTGEPVHYTVTGLDAQGNDAPDR